LSKGIEQFSKLEMSDQQNLPIKEEKKEAAVEAEGQKKLKPCCACPETKRARDQWYVCRLDYLLYFLLIEIISYVNQTFFLPSTV
jgi:hypothetical protein